MLAQTKNIIITHVLRAHLKFNIIKLKMTDSVKSVRDAVVYKFILILKQHICHVNLSRIHDERIIRTEAYLLKYNIESSIILCNQ